MERAHCLGVPDFPGAVVQDFDVTYEVFETRCIPGQISFEHPYGFPPGRTRLPVPGQDTHFVAHFSVSPDEVPTDKPPSAGNRYYTPS